MCFLKALHEQGLIEIKKICAELGEQVLSTKDNKISIGITIDTLGKGTLGPMLYLKNCSGCRYGCAFHQLPLFVSLSLWCLICISCNLVVFFENDLFLLTHTKSEMNKICIILSFVCLYPRRECSNDNNVEVCGIVLQGFGTHCVSYPHRYLTFSTSIGQTSEELQRFFEKLRNCFSAAKKKRHWRNSKKLMQKSTLLLHNEPLSCYYLQASRRSPLFYLVYTIRCAYPSSVFK